MQNLLTALRNAFPDLAEDTMVPTRRLSEFPNWDSMTAVNLLMEIETACGVKMEAYEPSDATTLAELAQAIVAAGGKP